MSRFAPTPLADAVAGVAAPLLGRAGFGRSALLLHWQDIVGPQVARCCVPLKLRFPRGRRDGGTLELKVEPARAIEIQHLEPQILERINLTLGHAAVCRLALRQGRVEIAPARRALRTPSAGEIDRLQTRLAEISAPDSLKAALERLGRRVLADSGPPPVRER